MVELLVLFVCIGVVLSVMLLFVSCLHFPRKQVPVGRRVFVLTEVIRIKRDGSDALYQLMEQGHIRGFLAVERGVCKRMTAYGWEECWPGQTVEIRFQIKTRKLTITVG